ncbi:N-6 DNA methylase [Methanohalobium evestigatum Z-7303]|uniref:site-specific DNA-methyltransferase (adenine-specific) n=1 Tax=Methanohalobium evestigatum (strain ATCC BAA-1072 / DSM 3721 / NBRC 107634 / OCM 161 / Z-7303) TaxID=644295 RepID=D7E836_METEZ|nr:class I SAM-dependent DNA methyltransferase [Methanohalobium evestigatum]ADI73378.1 N-6 DNA methylase [Methanohalobium evestigatum Z-7303]
MSNFQEKANFIWSVADEVLRDDFKRGKYRDVILPFTVLRRVECVLEPTKDNVIQTYENVKDKVKDPHNALCHAAGHSFYNTSPYDLKKLLDDPSNIGQNFKSYINSFSENMRDIFDKFYLWNYIDQLIEDNLLYMLLEKFSNVDLHPDSVSNHEMGYIFEELIRRFNEDVNENPGEHFTPREVIRLMVNLIFYQDEAKLGHNTPIRTIYDPACGTGGMLTIANDHILKEINSNADIWLFGQEVNPETFAIAKSDMMLKGNDRDAENIKMGSVFSNDGHPNETFNYMLSNPPFGKDWKKEQNFILEEAKSASSRFTAGLPRKDDGQLLFLQHMISKMKRPEDGGSRIAVVTNGSPLFTGDAGSGESEIRRWIIENDWLEAIVALPEQLFYNTGINTYVWIVTNRKEDHRKGKIQLVDARECYQKMRKSLGEKRHEISSEQIDTITNLHNNFNEGQYSQIFDNHEFGYRKITIEQPLRLSFQVTPERIEQLKEQKAFKNLAVSKKRKNTEEKEKEEAEGQKLQDSIIEMLSEMDSEKFYKNRDEFWKVLNDNLKKHGININNTVEKAILDSMSERDETADICVDSKKRWEPDSQLRDYENVPLDEDIYDYFEREVKPHVPEAWIDESKTDQYDNDVGKVGYIINFNRYFYEYEPPRPLEEIESDINDLENEILELLQEVSH